MKRAILVFLSVLLTLAACKPSVPDRYIQPEEMEEILYDYHLAGAMSTNAMMPGGDQEYAYRLAALQKHGVTQAAFDSSMVYYMSNTQLLRGIYERLSKRLEAEEVALGGTATQYAHLSSTGDTANIWTAERSLVLTNRLPYNLCSFELKADTAFHRGDRLMLDFDTQFIFQDGLRDALVVLTLTLGNDSVVSQTLHVSTSSHYTLQVADTDRMGIKAVRGYFLLNNESTFGGSITTLRLLPIYHIRLIRMRQEREIPGTGVVPTDSVRTDSAHAEQRPERCTAPESWQPTR